MSTKVSVVVPAYCTPVDGLDRLVASLDRQSLPADEFEVIFVDDGSPDDTWARLQRVGEKHPNVRLERIENSGWPSRPRNVGLELATGEYVLFMDHDDELYPDALRAGYAFAARNRADVLNGKETRTDQAGWAQSTYLADADNAIGRTDLHPLIPTNPHKLFRRELLMTHGIRFPEGGRVPWEDVFFCLDVAQHAEVVSVMASTPFYHWVRGKKTTSSSFRTDRAEYWRWVREIIVQTNAKLSAPRLATQHRLMLLHQYRSRVLTGIGGELFSAPPAEQELTRAAVTELLRDHIPEGFDDDLTPTQRGRAALARAGRWDLLPELVRYDAGLRSTGTVTATAWDGGVLRISAEARWATPKGRPLAVRFADGRVVRDLPAHVAAALPDAALDMTAALEQATAGLSVRGRESRVTWMLPTEAHPQVEDVDGRPELVVRATGTLDPQTAIFGRPLDEPVWDVHLQTAFTGGTNQRPLLTDAPALAALSHGHVYVAYGNKNGGLSLDVDQHKRSLTGSAELAPERAETQRQEVGGLRRRLTRGRPSWRLAVPFTGVATHDDTRLDGTVRLGRVLRAAATIEARPDGAWLETVVSRSPGTYRLRLGFHGRDLDTGLDITFDDARPPRLTRRAT